MGWVGGTWGGWLVRGVGLGLGGTWVQRVQTALEPAFLPLLFGALKNGLFLYGPSKTCQLFKTLDLPPSENFLRAPMRQHQIVIN